MYMLSKFSQWHCWQRQSNDDFLPPSSKTVVSTTTIQQRRRTWQQRQITKRWGKNLCDRKESIELVLKCGECMSNLYIYGGECICESNEGRYERQGKSISSTQLSKGLTWDRFKLNKAKIPDFQSFDFCFLLLYSLFKKNSRFIWLSIFSIEHMPFSHSRTRKNIME